MEWLKKVLQSLQANLLLCVLKEDIKEHEPTLEESLGFVTSAFCLFSLWKTDACLLNFGARDFADFSLSVGDSSWSFLPSVPAAAACVAWCYRKTVREGHDKWKIQEAMRKKTRGDQVSVPYQRSDVYHPVFNTALSRNVIPICDNFRLSHIYLSFWVIMFCKGTRALVKRIYFLSSFSFLSCCPF